YATVYRRTSDIGDISYAPSRSQPASVTSRPDIKLASAAEEKPAASESRPAAPEAKAENRPQPVHTSKLNVLTSALTAVSAGPIQLQAFDAPAAGPKGGEPKAAAPSVMQPEPKPEPRPVQERKA